MVNRSPDSPTQARPSLAQVAAQAGVAVATASYALRGHPKIPEATRLRVRAAADALGYRVNATVGRLMAELRSSRSDNELTTLAWINCHPEREIYHTRPWLRPWLQGARARAAQLGWRLEEWWMDDPTLGPARLGQVLRTRAVPGIVIGPTYASGGRFEMDCSSLAVVTMARTFRQLGLHQAAADDFANLVTAHGKLRELGYRRIGFYTPPLVCEWTDQRQVGAYLQVCSALPKAEQVPLLVQPENSPEDFAVFRRWYKRWQPDAIITPGSRPSEWLEAMGVRVPDDCGLAHLNLGADVPGWAGIDQHLEWIAASAVDMLIGQIHRHETGPPPVPKEVLVKGFWVQGSTVRPQCSRLCSVRGTFCAPSVLLPHPAPCKEFSRRPRLSSSS